MKNKDLFRFFLVGLIFCLASLLVAEKKSFFASWQELFPDHLERAYVIMQDGATFPHTSQDDAMVDMSIGRLKEELKKMDRNIKDIAVVIHNHRMKKSFSREDWRQYYMLKSYGFNGLFLLYCHRTSKVYSIEKGDYHAKN